jgi:uncharacterized repeat protein (TIGR01451 family)/fimbrial isopeptide formation D2 family protein
LLAIISLIFSLFAAVAPVIAHHIPPDGPEVTPTEQAFPGGNPVCPAGSVGIRFNNPKTGDFQFVTLSDGSVAKVTLISVVGNTLTFEVENGLAAKVFLKATTTQNVYDYSGFPGGGIAHDDGLVSPATDSISHVDFCLVPAAPELTIVKSADVTSVNAGESFTYTITVENIGTGTATDVVITDDTLDESLTVDSATFSVDGGTDTACTITGTDVSCDIGDLAAGSEAVVTIEVTTSAESCDEVRNTSTVSAGNHDDVDSNEVVVTVVCEPELTIVKSADVTSVNAGESFTYTITVENIGDATATDVVITDDTLDESLTVDSATFSVDGGTDTACTITGTDVSCDIGDLAAGSEAVVTIEVTTSAESCDEVRNTSTVSAGNHDDVDSNEVVVGVVCEELGSITIIKEIACEECETRTPGFWFNTAGSHDDETNALMADLAAMDGGTNDAAVEVDIDGTVYEFVTAQDVRDFLDADRSGEWDGETGLSRDGALLRHYLATWLNVLLNGDECDLLSRELDGETVQEILDEAAAALAGLDEAAEVEALEKLTAINESDDAEENPLTCGDSDGTSVDGFTFELFAEADYPDGEPLDTGTTGDDGPGTLIFEDLPLGTYVIVETGNDADLECEIVSVEGGTLNDDGSITVTLTEETPDVVLTVVNECEEGEEEENPGDITIFKVTNEEEPSEEFSFTATWDADGFTLMDGDFEFSGDLDAGEYTVEEELTAEQLLAGWSLTDIDCGEADVEVTGNSVTITLSEGESVECTFTNELEEEEEGLLEVDKLFCPTEGESGVDWIVLGPVGPEPLGTQGVDEELEECEPGPGVSFTIVKTDEPGAGDTTHATTDADGQLLIELPPGEYTITEDSSGESTTFTIADGQLTAIVVINLVGEDEGLIKLIKLFCTADEDSVSFIIIGGDSTPPATLDDCEAGDATFTLNDGAEFTVGPDGIRLIPVAVGDYVLEEVAPNTGTSPSFEVTEGEITTVIVVNNEAEEEGNGNGNEGTAGGGGGPGTSPDTATDLPSGSMPVPLLALIALLAVAGVAKANFASVRSREG